MNERCESHEIGVLNQPLGCLVGTSNSNAFIHRKNSHYADINNIAEVSDRIGNVIDQNTISGCVDRLSVIFISWISLMNSATYVSAILYYFFNCY